MSRASRSWTWRHAIIKSRLSPTTRHVLLTISVFMNDAGDGCYPTTKQLADATGLSERSVCTHIEAARDAGWLSVSVHGFKGQKWKNHQYEAAWPEDEGTEPDDKKALKEVQQQGTEARSVRPGKALNLFPKGTEPDDKKALKEVQSTSPVTTPITNSMSEPGSDAPRPSRKKREYPEAFEAFWQPYPRTPIMSKQEAFDAWKRLDTEQRAACVAAVPAFAAYCKTNPDYPPIHACRFISKGRYLSFAEQTTTPQRRLVTDDDWLKRLNFARSSRQWHVENWGPMPGKNGCQIPEYLLQPSDGQGWIVWEA
ncbi:helix-turn-helix protein [Pseudaminobacter salicylatoxidans]|uniref:Helix-turn-helix protein n=1 Tax=Pseudaminobacter salicylatoxidans TaxID=93369 RepID=A0A316BPA4_PSESE|nr:helix-turn-helix domain-containing protein [Pseudaminobacter salicylatoxidans]PWJ75268.1 helix-turn-helix protein [Pseudaminobacter salicylatoxidans]